MDMSEILPLLSRWAHVIAAIVLVGGTVFLRLAVVPVQKDGGVDDTVFESIRTRWSKWVMISVLFLLVSGLYNAALKAIGFQLDSTYLALLTVKIVLALIVFFMVSVLAGRSAMAKKFRAAGAKYYNFTVVAMLLLVCIAGYMKMSPQEAKVREETDANQVEESKAALIIDENLQRERDS